MDKKVSWQDRFRAKINLLLINFKPARENFCRGLDNILKIFSDKKLFFGLSVGQKSLISKYKNPSFNQKTERFCNFTVTKVDEATVKFFVFILSQNDFLSRSPVQFAPKLCTNQGFGGIATNEYLDQLAPVVHARTYHRTRNLGGKNEQKGSSKDE